MDKIHGAVNHCYDIAFYFIYYHFVKIHKSLIVTNAMQAGLTKKPVTIGDIINLVIEEAAKKEAFITGKKKQI